MLEKADCGSGCPRIINRPPVSKGQRGSALRALRDCLRCPPPSGAEEHARPPGPDDASTLRSRAQFVESIPTNPESNLTHFRTAVSNLQLRCRAHNRFEAEKWSGPCEEDLVREVAPMYQVCPTGGGELRSGSVRRCQGTRSRPGRAATASESGVWMRAAFVGPSNKTDAAASRSHASGPWLTTNGPAGPSRPSSALAIQARQTSSAGISSIGRARVVAVVSDGGLAPPDGRTPDRRTPIGPRLTTALHRCRACRRSEANRCSSDLPEWLEEVSERELRDLLSKFQAIAACGPEVDAGIDAGVGVFSSGL